MFIKFRDADNKGQVRYIAPMEIEHFVHNPGAEATEIGMTSGATLYVHETPEQVERAVRDWTGVDVEREQLPSDDGPRHVGQ